MNIKSILSAALVALALIGTSCSTKKSSLTYFEDLNNVTEKTFDNITYNVTIQPDDELFISVTSLIPEATAQYNLPVMNPGTRTNIGQNTSPQSQTYVVDNNGDIIFPVLGKLHVSGYTVEKLAELITEAVSKDVKDPIVKVELINFRVNVLGEVSSPGMKNVYTRRLSIFDALAMAGDITPFGERDRVTIIREENGKRTIHKLDLTKSDVFDSPFYYLQQNDVVYVEPNKIREDNAKYNQNNAYKLSVISTVVSAVSVIASLVIALSIK